MIIITIQYNNKFSNLITRYIVNVLNKLTCTGHLWKSMSRRKAIPVDKKTKELFSCHASFRLTGTNQAIKVSSAWMTNRLLSFSFYYLLWNTFDNRFSVIYRCSFLSMVISDLNEGGSTIALDLFGSMTLGSHPSLKKTGMNQPSMPSYPVLLDEIACYKSVIIVLTLPPHA